MFDDLIKSMAPKPRACCGTIGNCNCRQDQKNLEMLRCIPDLKTNRIGNLALSLIGKKEPYEGGDKQSLVLIRMALNGKLQDLVDYGVPARTNAKDAIMGVLGAACYEEEERRKSFVWIQSRTTKEITGKEGYQVKIPWIKEEHYETQNVRLNLLDEVKRNYRDSIEDIVFADIYNSYYNLRWTFGTCYTFMSPSYGWEPVKNIEKHKRDRGFR